jgi:site-specific recombinase XerD
MLAAGIDLKVTSDRLGHSSISIMADTYSDLISKFDR